MKCFLLEDPFKEVKGAQKEFRSLKGLCSDYLKFQGFQTFKLLTRGSLSLRLQSSMYTVRYPWYSEALLQWRLQ